MKRPARLELGADYFALGATRVKFKKTDVDIGETRFENGKLMAQGSVSGIRLSRLLQLMEKPPAVESTVVMGGRWEIRADKTVEGFIELSRTEGDIVIPGEEAVVLGLQEFRVNLRAVANRLSGEAILRSAQGDARVTAQTRLENRGGKWGIPGNAPLELVGNLQMQSIRPLATLASRAVTADGQLKLTVKAGGSFAEPKLSGSVEGDKLKLESVANGIFLRDGMIRATFGDNALTLTQFRFKAGEGEITAKGRFLASGISPVMELQWSASKLAVIQHPELRLTVSGAGELAYRKKLFSLTGALTADQGRVALRNRTFPTLGDDVVVVGREKPSQMGADTKRALLDLKLDLGPDFTIVGRGLDARMAGQVHLTSAPDKPLAANGEVSVASGTFEAYGRRLQIDKGNIYFAGPVNNPSLNIRAMRKNQQVEAGVEITGTARDPRIRLVSEPNVSDPNKLAWLVLGREAESGSAQDTNTMQSSAMAMAAGLGTSPLQQQLARAVGLDEITFIPGSSGSEGSVVAVGKQISDKIYLTQEFSTNAAANTFRVSYQLTRRWSLRSESGETDAVDLFFTFSFD
jgi:translocation and assembly module TamB